MHELLRTNDPVTISLVEALLKDEGIEVVVFDTHTSVLEGSIGAIRRRVMVSDDDYSRARQVLRDAEVEGL